MQGRQDFDAPVADAIRKNVGRTRHHEFAGAVNTAGATQFRMVEEELRFTLDHNGRSLRGNMTTGCDMGENLVDLDKRRLSPDEPHALVGVTRVSRESASLSDAR